MRCFLLVQRRRFCTVGCVPLGLPAFMVWGSNTSVGKTIVSTGVASSFLQSDLHPRKFVYLKPIQTGFPSDSDSRYLFSKVLAMFSRFGSRSLVSSNAVAKASMPACGRGGTGLFDLNFREEVTRSGECGDGASVLRCETLYAWKEPVSAHLAAERESGPVEDSTVLSMLASHLWKCMDGEDAKEAMCVIETAGGVASPGPSGTLQCDMYRPFRLPGILIGDGRLGGISATISAFETLKLRGYDVAAIVIENHGLSNDIPLRSYLRNRVPVIKLPRIPQDFTDDLLEWFNDSRDVFHLLQETMMKSYLERLHGLIEMPKRALNIFWWPFTQHKLVPEKNVTVIDARCGENFHVFQSENNTCLKNQFDACGSWWTQGPDMSLQNELARHIGYATARYGHVMFPENVYQPALACAELLLEGVGKGWASRVYFSDNGSTAVEIALKMAFRKFCLDNGWPFDLEGKTCINLKILSLRGSYHGDTLGAMEAQAPSSYTGFFQQPWYTGRGVFLDPPTVHMSKGVWKICLPEWMLIAGNPKSSTSFQTRDEIFERSRDTSCLADLYSLCISVKLSESFRSKESYHIAACLLEPVIQAAGGMHMIDPLFQRLLVKECRANRIPIIFDEVFTGFWRLGAESAAELLGCAPDIGCYAKLMTGGVVPLAATLATEAIFESFLGDSKLQALLHGHSYSGHAIGCTAAVTSIQWFKDPKTNPNLVNGQALLREIWDAEMLRHISSQPSVARTVVLGTLVALELQANESDSGYASLYAQPLLSKLREDGIYTRPLGNVIYFMSGPCTLPSLCINLLHNLHKTLQQL